MPILMIPETDNYVIVWWSKWPSVLLSASSASHNKSS